MLNKIKRNKNDNSKVAAKDWAMYLKETKGLERDYMAEIVKSRMIWQWLGMLCFAFAIFTVIYHQMHPLTIKEPFVLRVNDTTGAVDAVSTVKEQEKSYGEVVDSYFLSNFVISYESYNYQSIQADYDKTLLMSGTEVAKQYKAIYDSTAGKKGRDKLLGTTGFRKVKILSVVPDVKKGIATVRFQTETLGTQGALTENWVATMTYEYVAAKINNEVRLINPLGFIVTSYRVDQEIVK